jgi:hypothetical protein
MTSKALKLIVNNIQLILKNRFVFFKIIISIYRNTISPEAGNIGGHAVDTLTGLLIDLINNFDITNIILMKFYIRD